MPSPIYFINEGSEPFGGDPRFRKVGKMQGVGACELSSFSRGLIEAYEALH